MVIRRHPEDFVVEERLTAGALSRLRETPPRSERGGSRAKQGTKGAGGGGFAVYALTKSSLTTPDACGRLAAGIRATAGVGEKLSVEYAGLKDKHARTTQHVSVRWPSEAAAPPVVEGVVGSAPWRAVLVGYTGEPLLADAIACNRFAVVVRGLTPSVCRRMEDRAALFGDGGGSLVLINYFGEQRFASARHGRGFAGRCLVKGDYEGALRLLIATPARKDGGAMRRLTRLCAERWGEWAAVLESCPKCAERAAVEALARGEGFSEAFAALPNLTQTMAVEAYQSYLWNETARRMVEAERSGAGAGGDPVDIATDFGVQSHVAAALLPAGWRGAEAPMLSAASVLRPPWGDAAAGALAAEGVGIAELRCPGLRRPAFREAGRELLLRVDGFAMRNLPDDAGPGEARAVRALDFDLPRGAYATVVVRALCE